jgi:hypothetical protein
MSDIANLQFKGQGKGFAALVPLEVHMRGNLRQRMITMLRASSC